MKQKSKSIIDVSITRQIQINKYTVTTSTWKMAFAVETRSMRTNGVRRRPLDIVSLRGLLATVRPERALLVKRTVVIQSTVVCD